VASGGRLGASVGGRPVLVLETRGRRSARTRRTPVQYRRHGSGFVVVASNAGRREPPAWCLNLAAEPFGRVFVNRRWIAVHAEVTRGREREQLWEPLSNGNPWLARAAARAGRELPIIVLRPVRPGGEVVSSSVAETAYRRLGELDQWVMIRGESVANPPLIMLHGGPGLSETGLFRYFNAPLERSFTLVYWDQRGAGKSFDRSIPRSSMTVEWFISDLDELVDAVCVRLGKTKVAIFGHSWGSVLGPLYAARFPDKVAAYVGSGQIGDWAAAESATYAFALAEAERRGKRRAAKKLQAIGPPPHTADKLWTQRTSLSRLEGRMRPRALLNLGRAVLAGKESSILDLPASLRGFRWSLDATWKEVSRLNLIELAPTLKMPAFFFLGRNDHWVPSEISLAYIDALSAPSKEVVWFEESSHEPFMDEPAKFNATMAELVRPVLSSELPATAT
jgi:deazaflavin-dependent oxidoreductase (nitroreductase family)